MLTSHITYTYGALMGALGGSFIVHLGDTFAARMFFQAKKQDIFSTAKIILKSYIPVGIGVVPMRAASFGVYSVAQQFFYSYDGFEGKILAGILSGISLAALSTPAEILKTRKQLEIHSPLPWYQSLTIHEIKNSFIPLSFRVVPTVTCMLTGSEYIKIFLNMESPILSTSLSCLSAALISQIMGTPFENIRIYRIQNNDYVTSTSNLIKTVKSKLWRGFLARSLSLGIQATLTLYSADTFSSQPTLCASDNETKIR